MERSEAFDGQRYEIQSGDNIFTSVSQDHHPLMQAWTSPVVTEVTGC